MDVKTIRGRNCASEWPDVSCIRWDLHKELHRRIERDAYLEELASRELAKSTKWIFDGMRDY